MKEIWKDIEGYEELYQVSNLGRLRNSKGLILKQATHFEKYKLISLSKEGARKSYRVHRIVANAFIPNPENKPDINHINGKRDDNKITNLEWVTNLENQIHSWKKLGRKPNRIRPVFCVELNKKFNSIKEAALYLNLSFAQQVHISDCIKGRRNRVAGYHWSFV